MNWLPMTWLTYSVTSMPVWNAAVLFLSRLVCFLNRKFITTKIFLVDLAWKDNFTSRSYLTARNKCAVKARELTVPICRYLSCVVFSLELRQRIPLTLDSLAYTKEETFRSNLVCLNHAGSIIHVWAIETIIYNHMSANTCLSSRSLIMIKI